MAYMLWDVGECGGGQRQGTDYFYQSCATPVPKERLTWEQFRKDLAQRVRVRRAGADAVKREEPPGQSPDCAICTETIKDRCVLKRKGFLLRPPPHLTSSPLVCPQVSADARTFRVRVRHTHTRTRLMDLTEVVPSCAMATLRARTRVQLQGLFGVLRVCGKGPLAGDQLCHEAEGQISCEMRTLSPDAGHPHPLLTAGSEDSRCARPSSVPGT